MTRETTAAVVADAAEMYAVIHTAFAARPALDPPAPALAETEGSIVVEIEEAGGLVTRADGHVVATLLFRDEGEWLGLARVAVRPGEQHGGAGAEIVAAAEEYAAAHGYRGLSLLARAELPETVGFWKRRGYVVVRVDGPHLTMAKLLPTTVSLPTREDTQRFGRDLAARLRAGDLVILSGDLGAGKTTFTQGLGAGLGVSGDVTSPTFVIARVHRGPLPLVHVDAYRLAGGAELDDLDLDTDLDTAVTVVEWGEGLAETLNQDRLEIRLTADPATESRSAVVTSVGARWVQPELVGG